MCAVSCGLVVYFVCRDTSSVCCELRSGGPTLCVGEHPVSAVS